MNYENRYNCNVHFTDICDWKCFRHSFIDKELYKFLIGERTNATSYILINHFYSCFKSKKKILTIDEYFNEHTIASSHHMKYSIKISSRQVKVDLRNICKHHKNTLKGNFHCFATAPCVNLHCIGLESTVYT